MTNPAGPIFSVGDLPDTLLYYYLAKSVGIPAKVKYTGSSPSHITSLYHYNISIKFPSNKDFVLLNNYSARGLSSWIPKVIVEAGVNFEYVYPKTPKGRPKWKIYVLRKDAEGKVVEHCSTCSAGGDLVQTAARLLIRAAYGETFNLRDEVSQS